MDQNFFSQAGTIHDPSLSSLREQIKNAMIPMLIKIFQLKFEANQAATPSRLKSHKPRARPEEIEEELRRMDEDLKLLSLWCESCRIQVGKALTAIDEGSQEILSASTPAESAASISKSFSDTIGQSGPLQKHASSPEIAPTRLTFWQKLWKKLSS